MTTGIIFSNNKTVKCPLSVALRHTDIVFTLQPVLHSCPIMRDARFLKHLKEVILLITAVFSFKNPLKIEERKITFPANALPG